VVGKGGRRVNMAQKCVHMYSNAKTISIETISGISRRGGKRRAVKGVNSRMIYLIHCKNFISATMYPYPAQE
jgi:hypothetical protein